MGTGALMQVQYLGARGSEFKASLGYIVKYRPVG